METRKKSENLTKTKPVEVIFVDQDDDDDCVVILAGDPSKDVYVNEDKKNINGGDDVVIVRAEGQIACKDYPHPRHDCAKFPFNSCPHEKYCEQCYCYACDLLAPCAHWGKGLSATDHCHADKTWKYLRPSFGK